MSMAALSLSAGLRGLLARHWAVVVVAVVYLACLAVLPLGGIWINDVGNRIIQMESIVASRYSDFSIGWPGQAIDPTFDYVPIAHPFSVIRERQALLGLLTGARDRGLAVLPAPGLSSGSMCCPWRHRWVCWRASARLAAIVGGRPGAGGWAILIAGLCTPVWFYSLTFWEHTLAACCCVWGTVFLMRYLSGGRRADLAAAAALVALGTYFRAEALPLLVGGAAGGHLAQSRPAAGQWLDLRAGHPGNAGAAVDLPPRRRGVSPGAPRGHAGLTAVRSRRPPQGKAGDVLQPLLPLGRRCCLVSRARRALRPGDVAAAAPAFSPGLQGGAAGQRCDRRRSSGLAWLSFWVSGSRPTAVALVGGTNSLFAVAPLLMLGLLRRRDAGDGRDILGLVCGPLRPGLLACSAGGHRVGHSLGQPLPAGVVSPAGGPGRSQPRRLAGRVAGGRSHFAGRPADRAEALNRPAPRGRGRQPGAPGLVDSGAGPEDGFLRPAQPRSRRQAGAGDSHRSVVGRPGASYREFLRKPIFLTRSSRDYDDLAGRLAARGHSRILFIAPTIPGARLEPGAVQIGDNGLGFWNLDLVPLQLRPARAR